MERGQGTPYESNEREDIIACGLVCRLSEASEGEVSSYKAAIMRNGRDRPRRAVTQPFGQTGLLPSGKVVERSWDFYACLGGHVEGSPGPEGLQMDGSRQRYPDGRENRGTLYQGHRKTKTNCRPSPHSLSRWKQRLGSQFDKAWGGRLSP